MLTFTFRRLLLAIPTLVLISLIIFLLLDLAPGDPLADQPLSIPPEVRQKMLRGIPMRREGRIEEVAHATLFLCSDEASYITGVELPVDGGYLAV